VASSRWYADTGDPVRAVQLLAELPLAGRGALSVLSVQAPPGPAERYLWLEGEVGQALAELVRDGRPEAGPGFTVVRTSAAPSMPECRGERAIGVDQSNTSVVVGERLVVKLYRRLAAGSHPEIELGARLTEHGFPAVPALYGSVHYGDAAVASVHAYVPKARDGWDWAGDAVIAGRVDELEQLGVLTAQMHAVLAGLGGGSAAAAGRERWHAAARAQLERALAISSGSARAVLVELRERIEAGLEGLRGETPTALSRVHGDYHVGQILNAGGRLWIIDFEGEPGRSLDERRQPGSPLRDVAAMLRSFDHLARHVDRDRQPIGAAAVDRWIAAAREAFLGGYGRLDRPLLRAFEVEKECYEFTYAATYLPEWAYVAEGGMRWLMEHGDG
jgi:trehalose synthase-fused probable maltokinase